MDARAGTPFTPLYSRDPSAAAAAGNPSAGSGGLATAGAPPSIGLARSLFLPPRMTTATGGVAPAPSRAAAAPSKLPNAVRPKKGKTSAKKNKAAAEERKVALEERKVRNEERTRLLEWEKHLFFLDTSNLNEAQKEYVNIAHEEVLIQKRAMIRAMGGGGLGAMGGGGLGAMGGMGGFEGTMSGLGAMGGMGAPPAAMGGMGGFGAPPTLWPPWEA
ncbi:UDP-glycosyltransferase 73C6 [Hordeum vulgare]|nr:UDP-glycosyltransferase 73C6 [Hordeum vulgare]